jgi:putative transposase
VLLRYSFRIYPTPAHQQSLARAFGCARVVFNDALGKRQAAYEAGDPYVSDADLSAWLTSAKGTPERAWLNEVSAVVLQQALAELNAAYRHFFDSMTENARGRRLGRLASGRAKTLSSRLGSPRTASSGFSTMVDCDCPR